MADWNRMSYEFQQTLLQQEQALNNIQNALDKAKSHTDELDNYIIQLQMQNEALNNLADQIGQRMQERDEDLRDAYDLIDKLIWWRKVGIVFITCLTIGVVCWILKKAVL